MPRKLVGGLVAVVLVAGGVWWLWIRDKGGDGSAGKPAAGSARDPKIAAGAAKPAEPGGDAPLGRAPRWSLDKDREGPLQLEGQVVDPDGKGVGGAVVWLSTVPPRSATSEDDGTFSFDKLTGRTYQLTAKHGELIGEARFKLTEKSDPVVIRMTEGAALEVTVLDEARAPIAGAGLRTDEREEPVKTDDKGKAKLKPVEPGWLSVTASAPGYAPGNGITTVGAAGITGQLTIVLRKGFAVSGRVVDEAGKPVAKAKVAVASAWGFDSPADPDPITSDDRGQFTLPAVPAGNHTLTATDGEHAPGTSAPFAVTDRAVSGIEITVKAGGAIAGTVVDAKGAPVPYATVRVAGGDGRNPWTTAARQATGDKAGAFELRGLPRTKLHARAESDLAASQLVDVDLTTAADKKDLKLVLDVTGTIAGTVVDDKGAPVAEVQVNAFPDFLGGASMEGAALAGMASATSGGDGAFAIHGLRDGSYRLWAVRAGASNRGEWGQQGVTAKPGDTVKITLAAPGSLVGKLVLEGSGDPPKLANVTLGFQPAVPVTGGAIALKDLTPGNYSISIRGPEFAEYQQHDIKIEPGKATDLGTVTVMRGRKVTGKVVDGGGAGVAGAKIKLGERLFSLEGGEDQQQAFEEMGGIRTTISDQDGNFSIIGVPRKATSAMADHATRGRSLAIAIPEGTDDPPAVTLALRGFGSVVGKVTRKGEAQAGVIVTESNKEGGADQVAITRTDEQGNYRLAKVIEGPHTLSAVQQQMMSMRTTTASVTVVAGKESRLDIEIPVGTLSLTVQIKPLAGNKVDFAQTFLFSGAVNVTTAKQIGEAFRAGGGQGMKFWTGEGKPMPQFDELSAGDFSICSIPLTGGRFEDTSFLQKVQAHAAELKVFCKQVKLAAAPNAQTVVQELPSMTPFAP